MIDAYNLTTVEVPELYTDFNQKTIHPEGLLSEQIFGPVNNYRCACGNYNTKMNHMHKRCPICHVLCDTSDLRYKTFAKISLNFPIIDKKNISKFKKQLCRNNQNILDPTQSDLVSNIDTFLKSENNKLSLVDVYDPKTCYKLKITGLVSLFIALNEVGDSKYTQLFTKEIIVCPPQCRVNFKLETGKLINSDLNEKYISIIRYNNYIKKYITDSKIDIGEILNQDGIIDNDDIKTLDRMVNKVQYYVNELQDSIINLLSHKNGLIRGSLLSRTIDFSARAVLVTNPALSAYQITVPKFIFIKLWMIEFLRYLLLEKKYDRTMLVSAISKTEYLFINHDDDMNDFIDWFFDVQNSNYKNRLVLLNRQPTLWKYGITGVEVVGISEGNVINISPFLLEQINGDSDGDTVAVYRIHDKEAQTELETLAYNLNLTHYEHNDKPLHNIRLESFYAVNILLKSKVNKNKLPIEIESLKELVDDQEDVSLPIKINNKIYSYGVCLLNKWAGFNDVTILENDNKNISNILYAMSKDKYEYHNRLTYLNKKLLWFVSTNIHDCLSIPLDKQLFEFNEYDLVNKLPNNPEIGKHIYDSLLNKLYKKYSEDENSKIFKLLGTKLNKTQLGRSILSVGYIADNNNIIRNSPITSNLFTGLSEDEFFETCYGTRKGITDKTNVTPKSGYMERTMVMNLSPIELDMDDCKSENYFEITINSSNHAKSLVNRWFLDEKSNCLKLFTLNDFEIGKKYKFRSPITCKNPNFKVCRKCFGNHNIQSPFVGILAAQYINERLTQLTMRSFHTSGSCSIKTNNAVIDFLTDHLQDIKYDDKNDNYELIFDIKPNLVEFEQISGYIKTTNNSVYYKSITESLENPDITAVIKTVRQALNQEPAIKRSVNDIYDILITNILSVGDIFSSLIEVLLCNMFLTTNMKIYRYDVDTPVFRKLSVKTIHNIVSGILGLLYEPNRISIQKLKKLQNYSSTLSIFETIWLGVL